MDAVDIAKDFLAAPSAEALDKLTEMVKENPAAAVAIVGVLGIAYITKLGLDAVTK